jgi:integrase
MKPKFEKKVVKVKNPNHPKKGDSIRVEPIRDPKDIWAIKKILADSPRDLLLFTMGINNGLRAGDLLRLKVGDVRYVKEGDYITIKEAKTGKENILMINGTVHKALKNYFEKVAPNDDDFLFASRKTKKPLVIQAVNNMVKRWARAINLKGNYGAHTLRKTFGYVQRTIYKVGFEVLAKRFNHSSPAVTMRYLGIADKEVNGILKNEI